MKNFVTIAAALALTGSMSTGIAYAVESGDTPEGATLTIVKSVPAENAAIPGLYEGDILHIFIAQAEKYPEMYVEYELEGKRTGQWETEKACATMHHDKDNVTEFYRDVVGTYPMYEGVEYRIKINAWETEEDTHTAIPLTTRLGYAYINLTGTTKMYENSPYKLISINPEDSGDDPYSESGLLSDDTPYITVTFDGPVNLGDSSQTGISLGMGAGLESFGELKAVGESETINGTEYAKVWNLVFRDGYLASQTAPLIITIKATDSEGRVVQGNMGEFAFSYSQYYYNVPGMYGDIRFNFGKQPLESVSNIVASFDIGINCSYMFPYDAATVTRNGKVVAAVSDIRQVFPSGTDPDDYQTQTSGANMILDKAITEPGTYELNLPGGYFTLGTEFTVRYQKAQSVSFTIEGGSVDPELPATFTPEPGAELEALPESIFFDFGQEYICYGEYSGTVATITKDKGEPVDLPEMEYSYDWPKGQGYQELGEFANSTEKGTYEIYFPYDYFRIGHWSPKVDETTTPVEAMTITYIVDQGTGANVVSIKSDRYRVYDTNGLMVLDTTNADDLKALHGLYIVNGLKIVLK